MTEVPFTILLPLDEIVDALRPDVVSAVLAAKPKKIQRKPLTEAVLDASRQVASAFTRYEASLGTRDEARALKRLLVAASGTRAAIKNLAKPL
ncbi:hypothetical protein [Rhizobium metallidurans]|uniref:Phosphoenolpyruvate carboxylase n=1 Tax=Rhizobium metallidurans TaxID=1265931 RepID=A0A7W6G9G4_9HYPH|nr:hypothetical protein [Rhizobium metallidurans]MBB3963518.1 phosphoenolpyruvate carboxylase [Rhizobium metallidurans]